MTSGPRCLALGLIILAFAAAAAAQDVVTVGSVTADGPTVDVPVYIRDVAGTPLGVDRPAGSKIQSFSIKVNYTPASAVASVSFSRAGITAALSPSFEITPSTAGSISLLDSFQESTNPIPFNSGAPAPGDQVAHLVFTLSSSAAAGTTINLTLDSSSTQLSNQGGTTTETPGNNLELANGSIRIPIPSLALTPPSQSVTAGSSASLTATVDAGMVSSTAVALTSSNPAVASVPASVTIPAGARTAAITVSALSVGSATITATLPASAGGGTATATVTVQAAPVCATPAAPQIAAPATALAGSTYSVTWPVVADATEYVIDEATDAAFTAVTSRTVTTASAAYSHAGANVRYFYRVRARNRSGPCDTTSPSSATVSVLITAEVAPLMRILPVVGSTPGSAGSFFKTSLQLYNPRSAAVSGKIIFHTQAVSGSPADPSMAYSIAPGKTLSFTDLLPAMGVGGGLGSADLIGDIGSALPVALARVFNDAGAAGTSGLALEALPKDEALKQGDVGALLAPADTVKFRLNIGIRTLDQGVAITVTVRDRDGAVLKTLSKAFGATFFRQTSASDFLDGLTLSGGETISIEVTAGSAFIYGATTDNVTNDPSVQIARRLD